MNHSAPLTSTTKVTRSATSGQSNPAQSIPLESHVIRCNLLQSELIGSNLVRSRWVGTEGTGLRSRGLSPRALRRALAFMEANLGKRLSLDAVAASAAVSRFHFARLFRVTTGHSPMDFLMRARIERSKDLLKRGDVSICEVAATLGFCDQSHFTRTFRRLTGMSPREFIRRSQGVNVLN